MNSLLQQKCDQLIRNKEVISGSYKWGANMMNLATACMCTGTDYVVDADDLKRAEKILMEETKSFSEFRGNLKVPLLCKMVLSGQPGPYFAKVQQVYGLLHQSKWMGNEYKILAAMTICDHIGEQAPEPFVEKTNQLYKRMKEEHKWLTSDEDIPFAAMLAVSGLDTDALVEEMEKDFAILKGSFSDSNAVQSLSHILSVNEKPAEEKCAKVIDIFEQLKKEKHKYGTGYQLASLGMFAMLDKTTKEIVAEIIEADEYLKTKKGFGDFVLGESMRRMYAAQMVLNLYMPPEQNRYSGVLEGALTYTIAMEICMICMMTSVASSSSS